MWTEEVVTKLEAVGLGDVAEQLRAISKLCVRLRMGPPSEGVPLVGTSRFGGEPDLPSGSEWPTRDGSSLHFLLQIDLADIPAAFGEVALPREGLLSFFYHNDQPWGFDPTDAGAWLLVHTVGGQLERTPLPADLLEHVFPFPEHSMQFAVADSVPGIESRPWIDNVKVRAEDADTFFDTLDDLETEQGPAHHMFGYPDQAQDVDQRPFAHHGVRGERAGDHLPDDADTSPDDYPEWRLLLQLDSEVHYCWGDLGRIYFWATAQDLEVGRFDRVWLTLICG